MFLNTSGIHAPLLGPQLLNSKRDELLFLVAPGLFSWVTQAQTFISLVILGKSEAHPVSTQANWTIVLLGPNLLCLGPPLSGAVNWRSFLLSHVTGL